MPLVLAAVALVLTLGLGAVGSVVTTAEEGDGSTATRTAIPVEPGPVVVESDPDLIDAQIQDPQQALEPTPASSVTAEPAFPAAPTIPPTESPEGIVAGEPTSDATDVSLPSPTPGAFGSEGDPVDPVTTTPQGAIEAATVAEVTCTPGLNASRSLTPGGTNVYDCLLVITLDRLPLSFSSVGLEWTVSSSGATGWDVALGRNDAFQEVNAEWVSGDAPGLGGVESLTADDDEDGDQSNRVFVYTVGFATKLVAPLCGGASYPIVTLSSVITPAFDSIPGTEARHDVTLAETPTLAITQPSAELSRSTIGALQERDGPLAFSHADQTIDAGSMEVTVEGARCGGWTVSISSTEFAASSGALAFLAGNLTVTDIVSGEGAPAPASRSLQLTHEPQALVTAPPMTLPGDVYTYALNLELTIPGGMPPGEYTSTLTVTTSAAP